MGLWQFGAAGPSAFIETQLPDADDPEQYVLVPVLAETVGQYTDYSDMNLNPVFEGDVVCYISDEPSGSLFLVRKCKGCWMMSNPQSADWEEYPADGVDRMEDILHLFVDSIYILGNIHDHPYLLAAVEASHA